ncbi:hypothetical protein Ancab_011260 [Ancistrocladus abbreviatus]
MKTHKKTDRKGKGESSSQKDHVDGSIRYPAARLNNHDQDQSRQPSNINNSHHLTLSLTLSPPPLPHGSQNHQQERLLQLLSPTPPSQPPSDPLLQPPAGAGVFQSPHQPPSNTHPSPQLAAASSLPNANPNFAAAAQNGPHPRRRRHPSQGVPEGKSKTIVPPYPWATDQRATVYCRRYLVEKEITTIAGEVQCKKCAKKYEIQYDLVTNLEKVKDFAFMNRCTMHDRAPEKWTDPGLPGCQFCGGESGAKPVISEKKKGINWLFLLLGEMLGCCTIAQLKYFCKYTNHHRTAAKDRLLYTTYFELLRQLEPEGPW